MLIRVAPTLFQTTTGDTVRITAVAQQNNGPEAATFRYGPAMLPNVPVGQHPGCQFVVAHGVNIFGAQVFFAQGSPNAQYNLFEVDAAGNLLDLQMRAQAAFGSSIVQFQIDGQPVANAAMAAGAARAFSGRAAALSGPGGAKRAKSTASKKAAKSRTGRKSTTRSSR